MERRGWKEKKLGTFCSWKLRIRALGTGVLFFSLLSLTHTFLWLQPKASQPDEICKYMNFRLNIFQLRKQLIVFSILSLQNKKILEMDSNLPGLGQMSSTRLCTVDLVAVIKTSLVAQMLKRLSTMWETWVRSLGWEDSLLEKEMAIHSSTIAWKIPWTEEPGRLPSMGSQIVWHNWATSLTYLSSHKSHI